MHMKYTENPFINSRWAISMGYRCSCYTIIDMAFYSTKMFGWQVFITKAISRVVLIYNTAGSSAAATLDPH